jgi:hypothetical protein
VKHSEETVIDLGLLAPSAAAQPPPGDPVQRARAWWDRRRRAVACGLIAALVVVTAAASAPRLAAGAVTIALPPTGYGRFEVVGDLLFIAESDTSWRAYELPTGVPLWSLERPDDAPLGLVASNGLVLDRLYGSFGATRDPATGTVLLSPDQLRTSSGVATVHVLAGAETALASGDYRYYRDASPHPRFVRRASGRVTGWLAGEPPTLVRISAGGQVELRTPATGEVLASGDLPLGGFRPGPAAIFDDTLVLQSERAGELLLQGYGRSLLAVSWERPVSLAGDRAVWVDQCGPMLCIHEQSEGDPATAVDPLTGWLLTATRTEVVDPVTGRTAWAAAAGRTQLHPVGDRFLAYRGDGTLAAVLDAHTGRPLRQLTGWQAVVPVGGGARAPLSLIRTDQAGRTSVARLDLATLVLTEVLMLPGELGACQPFSQGIVCRHGHRLWVWTL